MPIRSSGLLATASDLGAPKPEFFDAGLPIGEPGGDLAWSISKDGGENDLKPCRS